MIEVKQFEPKYKGQYVLSLDNKSKIRATKRNRIFQDLHEANRYIKITFQLGKTKK